MATLMATASPAGVICVCRVISVFLKTPSASALAITPFGTMGPHVEPSGRADRRK
jgi:hypothetical protein